MTSFRKTLSYDTNKKAEVIPITSDIEKAVQESGIQNGTLLAYSLHTTLGLISQEALEPNLCQDIIDQLNKIVETDGSKYNHTCAKHPSGTCKTDAANGPSHVQQVLSNQNVILNIKDGKLEKGQWQDIALLELDGPRKQRTILIKIIKD